MPLQIERPGFAAGFPTLWIGQSTRRGGTSAFPAAALNLSDTVGDDPENVVQNRKRLSAQINCPSSRWAYARQIHGVDILLVNTPGNQGNGDALVTNKPGVLLTIATADCVPILIYDPVKQACGAAHAGWKGTAANIAGATIKKMQTQFGSDPADCFAYVGAAIGPGCFEVGLDVARQFDAAYHLPHPDPKKAYVDLPRANTQQLLDAGLLPEQIERSPFCTHTRNDLFFSYRAEGGQTGRMLSFIGLKPSEH